MVGNMEFVGRRNGNETRHRIYHFLIQFMKENGYAPSVREIGKEVGLSSTASVHQQLVTLQQMGKIYIDPHRARAIRIVDYTYVKEEEGER